MVLVVACCDVERWESRVLQVTSNDASNSVVSTSGEALEDDSVVSGVSKLLDVREKSRLSIIIVVGVLRPTNPLRPLITF